MSDAFRKRGERFDDADVARCYAFRPPYPAELFQAILDRASGRSKLLDLGTGNGKIACALAPHFSHVTAIDPSQPMLDVASRRSDKAQNIEWVCDTTEGVPLNGSYDVMIAGASIHWMKPEIAFPKLVRHLTPQGSLAIIVGDFPKEPPWHKAWPEFIANWANRVGDKYEPQNWRASYDAHETWIDTELRQTFVQPFSQGIDDFIECQHSRASWARHMLGRARTAEFDAELRALLEPHARNGILNFDVETNLTIGRPRATPLTQ